MYANETWIKAKRNEDGLEFNVNDMKDSQMGIEVMGHIDGGCGLYDRLHGTVGRKKRHVQVRLNPKHKDIKAFIDKMQEELEEAKYAGKYSSYHAGREEGLLCAMNEFKKLTEFEGNE